MSTSFESVEASSKAEDYQMLHAQLRSLFEDERDFIANAANFSALLFQNLPELNWAGIYIYKAGELVLGPFQGKPACVRIALGRGVCGTAAETRKTMLVENVHEFSGHIACDAASNSEIVVPIIHNNRLIGVLDIDSPIFSRFDAEDQAGLETLVNSFVELTDFPDV